MRIITPCLFLIAVAACATSEAKTPDDLSVVLASVTLADQCPTATPPKPPTSFAKPPPGRAEADRDIEQQKSQTKPSPGAAARAKCAPGASCGGPRRHCEQTSMQLTLTPSSGFKGSSVQIKRVELLDTKGKVLQTLTASGAMMWSASSGSYTAWDQKLGGDVVRASYNLTSPDWNKLTGGRMNAPGHTFQLRVIVSVGGSDRTVEKTSIVPARVAPMVVT